MADIPLPPKPASDRSSGKRPAEDNAAGKTVIAALLGGVASAVAYTVYQRLPDAQRDRLHGQMRSILASKLNEIRDGLNL
jgi:hypothetical protein